MELEVISRDKPNYKISYLQEGDICVVEAHADALIEVLRQIHADFVIIGVEIKK